VNELALFAGAGGGILGIQPSKESAVTYKAIGLELYETRSRRDFAMAQALRGRLNLSALTRAVLHRRRKAILTRSKAGLPAIYLDLLDLTRHAINLELRARRLAMCEPVTVQYSGEVDHGRTHIARRGQRKDEKGYHG
jgi:hypothetical protein